jgi:hypothetical protein
MITINTIMWESSIYNKKKWNISLKKNDLIAVGNYII